MLAVFFYTDIITFIVRSPPVFPGIQSRDIKRLNQSSSDSIRHWKSLAESLEISYDFERNKLIESHERQIASLEKSQSKKMKLKELVAFSTLKLHEKKFPVSKTKTFQVLESYTE